MLRQLRIKNFKVWQDTGQIRMAPITLFFGANSSGKSSIGQFLMMLKQTVESPDRKAVFFPGGKNTAVQLGSYQEMVYHRDPDKKIFLEYEWSMDDPFKIKAPGSDAVFFGESLLFSAVAGLGLQDQHSLSIEQLKYHLLRDKQNILSIGMKRKRAPRQNTKSMRKIMI